MRPSTLALHGASAVRGGRTVLDRVDVELRPGELTAIVGPNGAGKSTVLHALAGDLPLRTGAATLGDDDLRTLPPPVLARRRAVLTQDHDVAFPFPVRDVVAMGRAPWGTSGDSSRVTQALDDLELWPLADRPVDALSGGERARVHIARVLAQGTPALLLDEPTAALDLGREQQVLQLLGCRARAGSTVGVVLHDLGLAARHAHRVVLVADGRVAAAGCPDEVLAPDLLSAAYGHPIRLVPDPVTGTPIPVAVAAGTTTETRCHSLPA